MTRALYWAYVGFTEIAAGKVRPVLYIRQTDTDYIVFRLSSQYANKSAFIQRQYVEIKDWQQAGLSKPSWIDTCRIYQLAIDKTKLTYIGQLSIHDLSQLIEHFDTAKR